MLGFGGLFFREEKVVFALSSPKKIGNLSINHSSSDENSFYKTFLLFFQRHDLDKRYRHRQHRDIYIRKRSGSKIDSCGTPQFISPASEKKSSSVMKGFLFERYD